MKRGQSRSTTCRNSARGDDCTRVANKTATSSEIIIFKYLSLYVLWRLGQGRGGWGWGMGPVKRFSSVLL